MGARSRPSPARRHLVVSGLALLAAAAAVNSPLLRFVHPPEAWRLVSVACEVGAILVVLGGLLNQPVAAWLGAGSLALFAIAFAPVVWPLHPFALWVVAAVAWWQASLLRDRPRAAYAPAGPRQWERVG